MSARHRREVPGCFYGVDRESHWRDPRNQDRSWCHTKTGLLGTKRASFNKAMRKLKEQECTKKN